MGTFFKRHRELLVCAVLLAVPLMTYASYANANFVPGPARRAIVWVTSPVELGIVAVAHAVQDGWYGYFDLRDTHEKNLELRAKVLALELRESKLVELEEENARLRRLASYAEAQSEMRLIAAPVIGIGPDPKFRGIRIGRGGADGLIPGMAVVTPDGVVGRLSLVYAHAADVLLVTDPTSAVAAMSQRTRARASVRGLGDARRLRLDYVVRTDDLEDGDILVTAASSGTYPKGLRVGRATHVVEAKDGLFKTAEIVPAVDFGTLEEVQVVVEDAPSAQVHVPVTAIAQ